MSIFVEWFDNETCDHCGKENQPHCAKIEIVSDTSPLSEYNAWTSREMSNPLMLCSDCVEDLKKRLS